MRVESRQIYTGMNTAQEFRGEYRAGTSLRSNRLQGPPDLWVVAFEQRLEEVIDDVFGRALRELLLDLVDRHFGLGRIPQDARCKGCEDEPVCFGHDLPELNEKRVLDLGRDGDAAERLIQPYE